MAIKLRSVNIETDYELLKAEMQKGLVQKLTDDQLIRELVDWYRQTKLNK